MNTCTYAFKLLANHDMFLDTYTYM